MKIIKAQKDRSSEEKKSKVFKLSIKISKKATTLQNERRYAITAEHFVSTFLQANDDIGTLKLFKSLLYNQL